MLARLQRALGWETRGTLAHPSADLFALFSAVTTSAGVAVNAESALRSPTTASATTP